LILAASTFDAQAKDEKIERVAIEQVSRLGTARATVNR